MSRASGASQTGFTLLETAIAVSLGLFFVLGMVSMNALQARTQERTSRIEGAIGDRNFFHIFFQKTLGGALKVDVPMNPECSLELGLPEAVTRERGSIFILKNKRLATTGPLSLVDDSDGNDVLYVVGVRSDVVTLAAPASGAAYPLWAPQVSGKEQTVQIAGGSSLDAFDGRIVLAANMTVGSCAKASVVSGSSLRLDYASLGSYSIAGSSQPIALGSLREGDTIFLPQLSVIGMRVDEKGEKRIELHTKSASDAEFGLKQWATAFSFRAVERESNTKCSSRAMRPGSGTCRARIEFRREMLTGMGEKAIPVEVGL